jgi:hypothetical protein
MPFVDRADAGRRRHGPTRAPARVIRDQQGEHAWGARSWQADTMDG